MALCKDCKWHRRVWFGSGMFTGRMDKCTAPENLVMETDVIRGRTGMRWHIRYCEIQRESNSGNCCGPIGRWWKAK